MFVPPARHKQTTSPVTLENLEPRLLLTTLTIGDDGLDQIFIYRNSQDTACRITLHGSEGDEVELLSYSSYALAPPPEEGEDQEPTPFEPAICDLVGIHRNSDNITNTFDPNGDDADDVVTWPGGDATDIVDWDPAAEELSVSWQDFQATGDDATRGSNTELFVIYVNAASSNTILTLTTLSSSDFPSGDNPNAWVDADTWSSDTPILFRAGDDDRNAPDGSGGIIVGAIQEPYDGNDIVYMASTTALSSIGPIGVYPGTDATEEPLSPGITITPDVEELNRIMVAGTVSGEIRNGTVSDTETTTGGDIGTLYMGYLWGNITVGGNLNNVILRQGGGALHWGDGANDWARPDVGSVITAGKSLDFVDARGGEGGEYWMFSGVYVKGDLDRDYAGTDLVELESRMAPDADEHATSEAWESGRMIDYDNDSLTHAQFIGDASGTFTISGNLANDAKTGNSDGADRAQDWYAVPLMAGQTIRVSGTAPSYGAIRLYDSDQRWMGSFGYETVEDQGTDSAGSYPPRKPMIFTAPSAGVYYLCAMMEEWQSGGSAYSLTVETAPMAALGGINVVGDYDFALHPNRANWIPAGLTAGASVAANNGAGVGGIAVSGHSINLNVVSLGGGGLVVLQAGTIGVPDAETHAPGSPNTIVVDGNIGRIAATNATQYEGFLYADVTAGTDDGDYKNSYINNVFSASDLIGSWLWASGSIGVIEVGGTLSETSIAVNYDLTDDTAGRIDLIDVAGDWGGVEAWSGRLGYAPTINTGPGGNVGYIHVDGGIWSPYGNSIQPTRVYDGGTTTLADDGGGTLTITPQPVDIQDSTGLVIGQFVPSYSYTYITLSGGGGGVITRLSIDGPVNFSSSGAGVVEISDLSLDWSWNGINANRPTDLNVSFGGSGVTNIYYVHEASGNFATVNLNLNGDLVCGDIDANVGTLKIKGNLGKLDTGSTEAWLYGTTAAPSSANIETEPQYGWFRGRMNGLNVTGTVGSVTVDGYLGDLRVEGRLGTVKVNADGVPAAAGLWEGVGGVVWSGTRIDYIKVGDGLADDGSFDLPVAGIFSTNSIGTVAIDGGVGGRRVVVPAPDADINVLLRGDVIFGELNGAIIGASNQTIDITDEFGTVTIQQVSAIGNVLGTNGAECTALVLGMPLDTWRCYKNKSLRQTYHTTGGIGLVDMSGEGAAIRGSEISGHYVNTVSTSENSDGIFNSNIWVTLAQPDRNVVGQILAGGEGMYRTTVDASGGNIGVVKGIGSTADMVYNRFMSTDGMVSISARNLIGNSFYMSNTLGSVLATGVMQSNRFGTGDQALGAINKITCAGDFEFNSLSIARLLGTVVIGGDFIDSYVYIFGADEGNLQSLTVKGAGGISDYSAIVSYGRIGSIVVTGGPISGYIATLSNHWSSGKTKWDVGLIQANWGYFGGLQVSGTLKKFVCPVSLGDNPEDLADPGEGIVGYSETFDIWENLDDLEVGNSRSGADLYANINVGGNIGKLNVYGTLYGKVITNGNLESLSLTGSLGGLLDIDGDGNDEQVGQLTVFGTVKSMKLNPNADIFADLTIGGSLGNLSLNGASILGDLTSRYGSIGNIKLVGGSIVGDVAGKSVGKIDITNGDITGDITASDGNIAGIAIKGGDLGADVNAAGSIDVLKIVGDALAGHTITAGRGFGNASITGQLAADLVSGGGITSLTAGSISGDVSAETVISKLAVAGAISGSVRGATGITQLSAGSLGGATISSATSLGTIKVAGGVNDSFILAGYDVGADGAVGGGDDNPVTGGVHSGNIASLDIGGVLNGSIIAAGVGPGGLGGGAYAAFLSTGDNTEAAGVSSILKLTIKGGYGADASAVLADTAIDANWLASSHPGVTVDFGVSSVLSGSGTDFGPGTANGPTLVVGDLTLTLSGDGVANYNPATRALVLERTSSKSKLVLSGNESNAITITSSDDSGLGSLTAGAGVNIGDVTVDGGIGTWQVGLADSGAVWQMLGGINTAKLGAMSGVDITAGVIGAWTSGGAFTGTLAADAIKSLTAMAGLGADVSAVLGEATTLKISGGDFSGDLTARSGVKALTVAGAVSGDIDVTNGDLLTLTASGGFSGVAEVERGKAKNLNISGGNFTGSFQAAGGVDKLTVAKGGFSGELSTQGDIAAIKISGDLSGRLYSGGNIKTMTVGSMTDALAAAAGDFTTATVGGDMRRSFLFSGFDPGDDLAIGGSGDDADTPAGGSIKTVTIRGSMADSTISASVAPGADGYVGTGDDEVAGVGTVGRVVVYGNISGANVSGASYGVFAASNLPTVLYYRNQPFLSYGSAHTGSMITPAGNLAITDVRVTAKQIIITFNHAINTATIDFSETATVLVSPDADFGDGDNTNIGSYFATPIWTADGNILTLKLASGSFKKFDTMSLGMHFQVTLDGTVAGSDGDGAVTDNRGSILDGEYDDSFPTGDGQPGGNFVYTFQWGSKVLAVPSYNWRFGCVPTSVGMLAGYYDGMGYDNLIQGDASDQLTNSDVDETIASSGDGEYEGYGLAYTIVTPGTPGTGYIPDYALYDGVNDYEAAIHADLSDPAVQAASGVTPHADNCIADFLLTSQSYEGLTMGGTQVPDIAPGVEAFFAYKGYTATAQTEVFGVFTWNDLVAEIDAGRPVLLTVDSNADGTLDHEVIAVGYDSSTYEYLCNTTWDSNVPPVRHAFQNVAPEHEFGIADATLVTVA